MLSISWMNIIRLSQWERVVLTLVLTSLIPLGLHALALPSAASGLGQMWLPMFYAPLLASMCFRPHVSLVAGLCAPAINHLLFGMPTDSLVLPMTFHLVVFSAVVLLIRRRSQPAGWAVAAAYALALLLTRFIFTHGTPAESMDLFLRSMVTAIPGMLVLIVLTETVRHASKRQDV